MALAGQAFALRLAAQNSFMRSDWASRASLDMPLRCRRGFVWGTADATVDFGGRPRCLGFDSASHFGGRPRRLGAPAAMRENIRIASSMRSRSSWSSARVLLRSMFTEGYHVTPQTLFEERVAARRRQGFCGECAEFGNNANQSANSQLANGHSSIENVWQAD